MGLSRDKSNRLETQGTRVASRSKRRAEEKREGEKEMLGGRKARGRIGNALRKERSEGGKERRGGKTYKRAGLAYTLSAQSAHLLQRANTICSVYLLLFLKPSAPPRSPPSSPHTPTITPLVSPRGQQQQQQQQQRRQLPGAACAALGPLYGGPGVRDAHFQRQGGATK
ncbi:hypothetical protein CLOM_g22045 [Closterium sp. NIES-68]|nr:hypothetical protein CLOM_g22045 [Closterium sp. NIES-68]